MAKQISDTRPYFILTPQYKSGTIHRRKVHNLLRTITMDSRTRVQIVKHYDSFFAVESSTGLRLITETKLTPLIQKISDLRVSDIRAKVELVMEFLRESKHHRNVIEL